MSLSYLRYPILHDITVRLWYCFGFYPNKHLILTDSGLSHAPITLYCTLLLVVVLTNTVNIVIFMDTHLNLHSLIIFIATCHSSIILCQSILV